MTPQASPKWPVFAGLGLAALLLGSVWLMGRPPAQPAVVGIGESGELAPEAPPVLGPGDVLAVASDEEGIRDEAIPEDEESEEAERAARPMTIAAGVRAPQLIGRIVDSAGKPIGEADCLFSTERSFDGEEPPLGFEAGFERAVGDDVIHWVTEAAGEIRVSEPKPAVPGDGQRLKATLRPGAPLTGFVRRQGYVPLRIEGQVVTAFRPHDLGDLVMQRGAVIHGVVSGAQGSPVPNARLTLQQPMARGMVLWDTPGRGLNLGVTDRDGRFQSGELRAGKFQLVVEAPEASTVIYEAVATVGQESPEIKIRVGGGAVLRGRVLGLPEGRRIAMEAREPVSDQAGGSNGAGARARSALVSEADGSFAIFGLVAAQPIWLRAVEIAPFGRRMRGDIVPEIEPTEAFPGRADEVVLQWTPVTGAHGRVVAPSPDGGGTVPVESFTLSLAAPPASTHPFGARPLRYRGRDQRHFSGGRFAFDSTDSAAAAGPQVNLRVRAAGFEDLELMGVGLTPNVDRDLGDLLMRPAPSVNVKVIDADTGHGIRGAAVYAASVRWKEEFELAVDAGRPLWGSARITYGESAGKGLAILPAPPSGAPWLVSARAEGYVSAEPASVLPGEGEHVVALHRGGVVEVTAVDREGTPQHGVDLRLAAQRRNGVSIRSTTDRDGVVTFYGVPTGLYSLKAIPPVESPPHVRSSLAPYYWSYRHVDVTAPDRRSIEFVVPTFVDFEGRVTVNKQPVAGARLQLEVEDLERGREPTPGGPKLQAVSDPDGRFRFERIPRHGYRLLVSHPSRSMVMPYTVDVTPSMGPLALELPQALVNGHVVYADSGLPVENAEVTISGRGLPAAAIGSASRVQSPFGESVAVETWSRPGTTTTDSTGWFEFEGVATGMPLTLTTKGELVRTVKTRVKALGRTTNYRDVTVEVEAGGRLTVELEFKDPGQRKRRNALAVLERLDEEGKPVQDSLWEVEHPSRLVFEGVSPGQYRLQLFEASGRARRGMVSDGPSETRVIKLALNQKLHLKLPGD